MVDLHVGDELIFSLYNNQHKETGCRIQKKKKKNREKSIFTSAVGNNYTRGERR